MPKVLSRECPVMNGERGERAPKRAKRLTSVKAGWPKSREAHGYRVSVGVRAGESVSQYTAKGDRSGSLEEESLRNAAMLTWENGTDWRAGCTERRTSGSEGGSWKSTSNGNSLAAYPIA